VREKREAEKANEKNHTQKSFETKMASNNSLPSPPIFSSENFHLWAAKMRSYLRAQRMWNAGEDGSIETLLVHLSEN